MIKRIGVYETKGKQFNSLQKAIDYREVLIEEFLRKSPGFREMSAKHAISFIQHIIDNRKVLTNLFDYDDCDVDRDE